MSTPSSNKILIAPVGNLDRSLLHKICAEVRAKFGYSTGIMPILHDAEFAFDPARKQYHSTMILERLSSLMPPYALKVLGVFTKDLFIPVLTHVYGEAQMGGRACIISLYRLDEDTHISNRDLFHQRVIKEAVHELGHTFNLRHCTDRSCDMH